MTPSPPTPAPEPMSDLSLCPFCGSLAEFVDTDWAHHVDCTNPECGAFIGGRKSKEAIVAAWNRRSAKPASPSEAGQWQPIDTAPQNHRVIVKADNIDLPGHAKDEIAMAWWDVIDQHWYYAPQGGRMTWKPEKWCHLPEDDKSEPIYGYGALQASSEASSAEAMEDKVAKEGAGQEVDHD